MPITFINTSNGANSFPASAVTTCTLPADYVANDLFVMAFANSLNRTITTPSGWTRLTFGGADYVFNPTGATIATSSVFYKVATGSESSTFDVTISATNSTGWCIALFRGADPADPIYGTTAVTLGDFVYSINTADITPTKNGCGIFTMCVNDNGPAGSSGPYNGLENEYFYIACNTTGGFDDSTSDGGDVRINGYVQITAETADGEDWNFGTQRYGAAVQLAINPKRRRIITA